MNKQRLQELAGVKLSEAINRDTETALNNLIDHGNKHFGPDDKTWKWVANELHAIIDYHP